MKPVVKKFSRTNPCTREDIWACFDSTYNFEYGTMVTREAQVDYAHSIIGIYTPRELIRAGRAEKVTINNEDCYQLTEAGEEWLAEWYLKKEFVRKPIKP